MGFYMGLQAVRGKKRNSAFLFLSFTSKTASALVMAVGLFSHFVLDIPVHRMDLGLIGNMYKIGFGLYNYPLPAFLLGGLWLNLRSTTGTTFLGKYGMILLALLLLLINAFSYWG